MRSILAPLAVLSSAASMTILAIVQGVTEFLPISSSGHLVLAESVLHVGQGSILDDVMLHVGTLVAVVAFYHRDLARLVRDGVRPAGDAAASARRYVLALVVGTLPAVVVGLAFKDRIEALFDSVPLVLGALAVTGVMLFATRWIHRGSAEVDTRRAVLIGVAQAIAIVPGCSRSGWTIATGLVLGLGPAEAARFSFLLSIPAILGATVLELRDVPPTGTQAPVLGLGMLVAAVVGLASLWWLVKLVRGMRLHRFAYYLWALTLVGSILWASRG